MKRLLQTLSTLMIFFVTTTFILAQKTIKTTIVHGGLVRSLSFYVPAKYTKGNLTPLVFNLHGYTSNGDQQELYGDFRKIADTAGFIVVHPTGTLNSQTQQTFWNCGLVGSSPVDDVGFIHAIIDTLSQAYSIDENRIYSCGMSNGGFMSYHLACLSDRFAAIGSVTGSMTTFTTQQCSKTVRMPIMEIHGDADAVVAYNGGIGFSSIPKVIEFWIAKNGLDPMSAQKTNVPNINTTDNATAELYIYPGMNEVQHYKVLNGGHTWPGAPFNIGTTCMDFNASKVLWEFFSKHKKLPLRTNSSIVKHVSIYPNPVEDILRINSEHEILTTSISDQNGRTLIVTDNNLNKIEIDTRNLVPGVYILNIQFQEGIEHIKFIKN
ncbi:MAG: T9SS type A sorting domain-containing protein [Saprospiraceae bacterium]|nr:T9SS type A sorting domain-containing protein [Saprospiraceae bacterium]